MVKQRQESLSIYEANARPELADQEREEIAIIMGFMPQQMDDAAGRAAIDAVVAETGAAGMSDMGKVMAALKERYAGPNGLRQGQRRDQGAAERGVKGRVRRVGAGRTRGRDAACPSPCGRRWRRSRRMRVAMPGAVRPSSLISAGVTLIRPFGAPSPGGRRTRRCPEGGMAGLGGGRDCEERASDTRRGAEQRGRRSGGRDPAVPSPCGRRWRRSRRMRAAMPGAANYRT